MHGDPTWKDRYNAGVDAGKTDLQDHFKAGTKSGIHYRPCAGPTPQDFLGQVCRGQRTTLGVIFRKAMCLLWHGSHKCPSESETISPQFCEDRTISATPSNFLWVLGFKLMLAKQVFY